MNQSHFKSYALATAFLLAQGMVIWAALSLPQVRPPSVAHPPVAAATSALRVGLLRHPAMFQSSDNAIAAGSTPVSGFERDLVAAFASAQGLMPEFTTYSSKPALMNALSRGDIDLAPSGLSASTLANNWGDQIDTRAHYRRNDIVLAYGAGAVKPARLSSLAGSEVAVSPTIAQSTWFAAFAKSQPTLRFVRLTGEREGDMDAVIALHEGAFKYALLEDDLFAITQHVYPDLGRAFSVHQNTRTWLFASSEPARSLRARAEVFLSAPTQRPLLAQLTDRHFGHTQTLGLFDLNVFEERLDSRLPNYRSTFEATASALGLDWRLVAALAYQESQWDPKAVSPTAVKGLMQLTQGTAQRFNVDRTNPSAAIAAGSQYLAWLLDSIPSRLATQDRLWMALAAYNVGLGHVEDARILAQRRGLNPDLWVNVKAVLPLLSDPKVAATTKNGLCRGYEPVTYVDRVRVFYDVLAWHEPREASPLPVRVAQNGVGAGSVN